PVARTALSAGDPPRRSPRTRREDEPSQGGDRYGGDPDSAIGRTARSYVPATHEARGKARSSRGQREVHAHSNSGQRAPRIRYPSGGFGRPSQSRKGGRLPQSRRLP